MTQTDTNTTTADELRQAKQRIAALEKEIEALRASSCTPTPTTTTTTATINSHPSQSNTYPIHSIPIPIPPPNTPSIQLPKPNPTIIKPRLMVMTRKTSTSLATDINNINNQLSSSQNSDLKINKNKKQQQQQQQSNDSSSSIMIPILSTNHQSSQDNNNNNNNSQNIIANNNPSSNNIIHSKSNQDSSIQDSPSKHSNHSNASSCSNLKKSQNNQSVSNSDASIPRRRPPPLPVVKTSSTKKERHHLVAKCTEPKPGQTRYWTEEEHERFLEAVAEYGEKAYVAISNYVETRTPKQVRTHAQKFQMKMARLARQSIEAGQAVHMPAGMRPVVELPIGNKSTIVSLPSDQVVKIITRTPRGNPITCNMDKTTISLNQSKEKSKTKSKDQVDDEKVDDLVRISSTISNESTSVPTDPYLDYLGASRESEEMKLENTFAVKLTETLQEAASDADTNESDFIVSEGSSHETEEVENDKLEDIENIEDGDLSLAQFSNSSDNWLLPDSTASSTLAV